MTELKPLNRSTAAKPIIHPERVIQFGGGNFLRAFVDWIIDILNEQTDFASSVVIVKPTSGGSYADLENQEGLFHVRAHDFQHGELVTDTRLVSCVSRVVNPYSDFEAYLALARQPEIRFIISNTTEQGLTFAPNDTAAMTPPESFPAKLTLLLYERYRHFQGSAASGCIILPCELVEKNGQLLRDLMLRYSDQWGLEAGFKTWLMEHNHFCDTLVDRIVPGFPSTNSDVVLAQIGYADKLLVEAEQYHSFVIEMPASIRHELPVQQTRLNVLLVDDVTPYRLLKVRILNGAHTSMVATGYLLGLEFVKQAMDDPRLSKFIRALVFDEILPPLPIAESEREAFANAVLARFNNPFIQHKLLTIALNSTSKLKARIIPSLVEYTQEKGELPARLALVLAAFWRFYQGEWQGNQVPLSDDPAAIAAMQQPVEAVLANVTLWGQDLTLLPGLVDRVNEYVRRIDAEGIAPLLENV